jgi:hypothetical protein
MMKAELAGLVAERASARSAYHEARFLRDAASVYCDSVLADGAHVTLPDWVLFSSKQASMDVASDRLILAHGAVADHVLLGA